MLVYLGGVRTVGDGVVRRLLRPGMCFVDVGANIGYFTLLAARRVGSTGRVFAIEPSPYAADRLSRTVAANVIPQVRIERCGLGCRQGEVVLYDAAVGNHCADHARRTREPWPGGPGPNHRRVRSRVEY